MERLVQLGADIAKLWEQYGDDYLNGIQNTLILALVATLLGCIIGFVCGILNTIPCAKTDPPVKRFFIKLIRVIVRIYVEVFRGTPMMLQAVFIYYGLPYFTGNAVQWPSVWMAAILEMCIRDSVQGVQHLFQHRHLDPELLRHGLAGGLVGLRGPVSYTHLPGADFGRRPRARRRC